MSVETKQALETALAAHFADEFEGAHLTSWVLQGYGTRIDTGSSYYMGSWPEGQPLHITGGLIDYASQRHSQRMAETVTDVDDDE